LTKLQQLAEAIAHYEGFYVTEKDAKTRGIEFPTIPQRLHNPGDLIYDHQPGAVPFPIVGKDGKTRVFAKFEMPEQGWDALYHQIRLDASRGETLLQFINKYAPAADANDPRSYAAYVARQLHVQVFDPLHSVIAEDAAADPPPQVPPPVGPFEP
jgi:hypothetical protein